MELSNVELVKRELYPEVHAGGFSRVDGTVQFYQRINALLRPDHIALDIGAGRGQAHHDDEVAYRKLLRNLKGRCAKVIGIDVDPAVRNNPSLDESHIIKDGKFPIASNSIDIAFSDYTFEHVDDPEKFSNEVDRVLKPGGWICARTPNKYGYVSLGANIAPNQFHVKLLRKLQPTRKEVDVFPTRYRLNTRHALAKHFPPNKWDHYVYIWDPEPAYFGSSKILWRIMMLVSALSPQPFKAVMIIFCQKKPAP